MQELYTILQKYFKTKKEKELIYSLIKKLKYLQPLLEQINQVNQDQLLDIFSKMKVETFKTGDIVFAEKDPTNQKIYIIAQGKVFLVRNKQLDDSPQDSGIFRQLHDGDGFGERSVLFGGARSLTAQAASNLTLFSLLKEDIQLILHSFIDFYQTKAKIINSVFSLKQYSTSRCDSVIYSFQPEIYKKEEILCEDGMTGNFMYLVMRGDIMVSKKFDLGDGLEEVPMSILSDSALGEEIIVQDKYLYTYKVVSVNALVLKVSKDDFRNRFPQECKKQIVKLRDMKWEERKSILYDTVQRLSKQRMENKIKKEKFLSARLSRQLNLPKYSMQDPQLSMKMDKDLFLRNFIKSRASSQYLNSSKGFHSTNFFNYPPQFIVDQKQKNLKEEFTPIVECLDFGKGEVEEMNKRKHIQLSVMNLEKINYLNQIKNPQLVKLKEKYIKSYRRYSVRNSQLPSGISLNSPQNSQISSPKSSFIFKCY
ncbi:hypothetical protein pb186bvf_006474 [Paramecium bursaria]